MTSTPQVRSGSVTPLRPASVKPSRGTTAVKITHEQIAQRAHDLWVKQGGVHGYDQQHWLEAERQLKAESAGGQ